MDEASFKAIVSGERRGLAASLLRSTLAVASVPYGFGMRLRNAAFDRGWKPSHRTGMPVISIGNVTTGGTGKTPLVAFIVEWLRKHGRRPAILSRGYRSLDGQANDEKLVLDRLCPGVPHIQNRDRIAGAKTAITQHSVDALVLDDAFQHRRIARDLDIVLIDALNPWGYGHLLPRGLLREPITALRRAGLVVVTRSDQATPAMLQDIASRVRGVGCIAPIVETAFPATQVVSNTAAPRPLEDFRGQRVVAFCGIGNPTAFRLVLESAGLRIERFHAFPDHHHYGPADLEVVRESIRQTDAAAAVTTEKDLVKIPASDLAGRPLHAVRIETRILSGAADLVRSLTAALHCT
jgi:tetraacyldisaccharide 4'-kinase